MATIVRNRIRLALDAVLSRGQDIVDALTGLTLRMYQAEDVQFEAALFSNGTIAADISNFTSITLELKDPANLLGAPLMTLAALKTGSSAPQVDLDQDVSLANWNNGTEQHAVWVFAAAATNIELAGARSKDFTLFFWGTTTDVPARRVPLGVTTLTVMDSGYGDLGAITVTAPGARMKDSKLQVYCPDNALYYDVRVRVVAGVPAISLEGDGEA